MNTTANLLDHDLDGLAAYCEQLGEKRFRATQLFRWIHHMRRRLNLKEGERAVTNVVMMGMGEPLQNYSALVPALRVMLDDHGYGLSRRRVTVSTSGVVPMMDRLREDCPVALAVSLHAPNDELRDNPVPLNRNYPLADP